MNGYNQWCLVDIQSVELSWCVSGWLQSVVIVTYRLKT